MSLTVYLYVCVYMYVLHVNYHIFSFLYALTVFKYSCLAINVCHVLGLVDVEGELILKYSTSSLVYLSAVLQ